MTQEEKDLLLKDLCARLPYELLISIDGNRYRMEEICNALIGIDTYKIRIDGCDIEKVKPYLFPLSSMSEEQSKTYHELVSGMFETSTLINFEVLTDFFHKNHLDYRGFIPMGLAIDATNLNIY